MLKKISLGAAALSLMAAPAVAQMAGSQAIAPLSGEESSVGAEAVLIGVLATAAVVGGIVAVSSGNNTPVSR